MSKPEDLVIEELGKFGLQCERFSKKEMRLNKTPDFRVFKAGQFAFFCEVKEVAEDPWSGGLRSDPIFNRLTDDIHTAIAQFDCVNPLIEHPNVLAFVNNDRMCGSLDLIGVTTGLLLVEGDEAAPVYQIYSEGRIRDEKKRIHLYLWYDSFKANKILFNPSDIRHWSRLCNYFNVDPDQIKPIGR